MFRKLTLAKASAASPTPSGSYSLEFNLPTQRSVDEVWGALTKPDKLADWLMPVTGKLGKGGAFTLGEAAQGTITQCEPKRRLTLSLRQGARLRQIEITFGEEGKGKAKTRLIRVKITAQMEDLPDGVWQKFGPAALGIGWELVGDALLAYLANPKTPRATGAMAAFAASAEGASFTKDALEGWFAAAKAQGLDLPAMPAPSLLHFYTGLHR